MLVASRPPIRGRFEPPSPAFTELLITLLLSADTSVRIVRLTESSRSDSSRSRASQMEARSSLDASLRPRSTSERYPSETFAAVDTSRSVLFCLVRAWRNVSPSALRRSMSHLLSAVESRLPNWTLMVLQLSCTARLHAERFLSPEVLFDRVMPTATAVLLLAPSPPVTTSTLQRAT